jgi:hypothetical protein
MGVQTVPPHLTPQVSLPKGRRKRPRESIVLVKRKGLFPPALLPRKRAGKTGALVRKGVPLLHPRPLKNQRP